VTEPVPANGEALAIIVNRKNPADDLTLDQLRKLCVGEQKIWPEGGNVTVALREKGQPERDAVLRQIYRMSESAFARNLLKLGAGDEAQNIPKELATAKHVCRFVFNVPGAIGFVRASEVDKSVKVIRLDGLAVNDPAYKLKLPGQ
jgi:ABC-type phosphate transport system substrate-binding protein